MRYKAGDDESGEKQIAVWRTENTTIIIYKQIEDSKMRFCFLQFNKFNNNIFVEAHYPAHSLSISNINNKYIHKSAKQKTLKTNKSL